MLNIMYHTRKPMMVADLENSPGLSVLAPTEKMQSFIGVPIMLQSQVIGFINIFCQTRNCFNQDTAERMSAFAAQVAIAIQNARLYHRSKELAAVQERQRLARELHDSVSQTLFSAQTMAEAGLRQWVSKPDRARTLMDEVHGLLVGALAEMRILLLELRPASLTQVGLKQLFEQYLEATLSNQDIEVQFDIEDIPIFSGDAQIALYRIVQEAVNNVVKHAEATLVTVRARVFEKHLILTVEDNGRGFNLEERRSTSLGLGIMRERAENIDAQINIDSKPGKGTSVTVTWPTNESRG
jgi:signal transduction histidine kinase